MRRCEKFEGGIFSPLLYELTFQPRRGLLKTELSVRSSRVKAPTPLSSCTPSEWLRVKSGEAQGFAGAAAVVARMPSPSGATRMQLPSPYAPPSIETLGCRVTPLGSRP
jgi:hypothetical protein